MDTKFLKEALFEGMTSNAFKLGTVLSLGWFWMRGDGCHNIYRGQDGVMDYNNVVAVMNVDSTQVSIAAQELSANTLWHYLRRQASGCGLESPDSDHCIVRIDANGDMILPLPNVPGNLRLENLSNGKFRIRWRYSTHLQEIAPAGFKVYMDSGSGFNFASPDATINYGGGSDYSWDTGTLVGGQVYRFCVRSYISTRQTINTNYVSGRADDAGPDAATGLIADWEEVS